MHGLFQSTPPRGGRRPRQSMQKSKNDISIHAPARGATPRASRGTIRPQNFNPRPRAGGDAASGKTVRVRRISIHAPARGATRVSDTTEASKTFQSTPPRGGRPERVSEKDEPQEFQSTPPRGGRLFDCQQIIDAIIFQSTPPRGGRHGFGKEIGRASCRERVSGCV